MTFLFVAAALSLFPLAAFVLAIVALRKTRALRRRIEELEDAEAVRQRAGLPRAPAIAPPPPVIVPPPAPPAFAPRSTPSAPVQPPLATPPLPQPPVIPPVPQPLEAPRHSEISTAPSRLESMIGGVWLQNVGSTLLLLGAFFLIVWGYTKGRIGPDVLVLSGVILGIIVAWRGDRIARHVRALGHAILGVGLGIVYMTLYLGHFNMQVLPSWAAFGLLALVSFVTIDVGLRRAQPTVAAFGVLGAFLPLLFPKASGWGFHLGWWLLLAYLVLANAVVFVLTALRGWSGLVVLGLLLTASAWLENASGLSWPLSVEVGLTALFTALEFAPVVRLARQPDPVKPWDLAVVMTAPLLMVVASYPYLAGAPRLTAAVLFFALAAIHAIAAVLVDRQRAERDLWRPLTVAATLFLTAALERALVADNLALAWCIEGAGLIWLGLRPRGEWLRGLGYAVSILAGLRMVYFSAPYSGFWSGTWPWIANATPVRDAFVVVATLATADRLAARREHLSVAERHVPAIWLAAANAMGVTWLYRAADAWWQAQKVGLTSLLWSLQAFALVVVAHLRRSPIHRHLAYVIGPLAQLVLIVAIFGSAGTPSAPIDARGWLMLAAVAVLFAAVWLLSKEVSARPDAFGESERLVPRLGVALANAGLVAWLGREGIDLGRYLQIYAGWGSETLCLVALSWSVHALALTILAGMRRSAVHRHIGYPIGALALLMLVIALLEPRPIPVPILAAIDARGVLTLAAVACLLLSARFASWQSAKGPPFSPSERLVPETGIALANGALALWSSREATHLARYLQPGELVGGPGSDAVTILTAVLMSGAWLVQSGVLFGIGWLRRRAFYRWMALALVGMTLAKFAFFDLQRIDVFWRFIVAIGIGAALMLLSYMYQRRSRSTPAEG